MFWDIKYISRVFCHKTNICTLINIFTYVQPDDFYLMIYLRVTLLVSFPELPFGGPELGVNLAVIIVVLEQVMCLIIILVIVIVIIIPVFLFLFLFLFPFLPLHFLEPSPDSVCSSLFILNHLLLSAHCRSWMYLTHVSNQLIF